MELFLLNVSNGFVIDVHIGISERKYRNYVCDQVFTPKNLCPKKREISFITQHNTQEVKNVIYGNTECCIVDNNSGKKYIVSKHKPIAVGFIFELIEDDVE